MKLCKILAAAATAVTLTNCVTLQNMQDQLRDKYGCVGIGEAGFIALFMDSRDVANRAMEKSKQDYQEKCAWQDSADYSRTTIYLTETNTAYTFSLDGKLKE